MVFESTFGDLTLVLKADGLPSLFDEYCKNSTLAEQFETDGSGGRLMRFAFWTGCCEAVGSR
jgi:hypothetical protein